MATIKLGEPFGLDNAVLGKVNWSLAIKRVIHDLKSDFIYAPHLSFIYSNCPKCNHRFNLSEGISRQAIERHAGELERSLAEHKKKLEAQLAAEAKAQFDLQLKALNEALSAKEGALARFRSEELTLRRQLREVEEARKNQDLEYQRKLDAERKKIEEQARSAVGEEVNRREAQWKAQLESAQREAADLKRKRRIRNSFASVPRNARGCGVFRVGEWCFSL
jgi:hypothetical protein